MADRGHRKRKNRPRKRTHPSTGPKVGQTWIENETGIRGLIVANTPDAVRVRALDGSERSITRVNWRLRWTRVRESMEG